MGMIRLPRLVAFASPSSSRSSLPATQRLARASGLPVQVGWDTPRVATTTPRSPHDATPHVSPRVSPRMPPRRHLRAGWTWEGVIVGRAFDAAFTREDYLLMQCGGSKRALRTLLEHVGPDVRVHLGVLSDYAARQARRALDRHCLDAFEAHNVGCNAGRNNILNFIEAVAGFTGVQYLAIGGPNVVTPNATDTQLSTEFYRTTPATDAINGNTATIAAFLNTSQGNGTYTECGLFGSAPAGTPNAASGGPTASATANTGMLFAHSVLTYTKTSALTLTIDYAIFQN